MFSLHFNQQDIFVDLPIKNVNLQFLFNPFEPIILNKTYGSNLNTNNSYHYQFKNNDMVVTNGNAKIDKSFLPVRYLLNSNLKTPIYGFQDLSNSHFILDFKPNSQLSPIFKRI